MTDDQIAPLARRTPLDPYSSRAPHLVGIVDTNALLSSIENDCRKGFRSRLLRMGDDGIAVLYAADHVLDETYEHLPKMAKRGLVPLSTLRAHFEAEYLPALRFVTVSDVDGSDAQVMAITDTDDVPTGRLAKLIAPCVVFSDDRHLKKPGFAPKDWQRAAKSVLDIAEGVRDQAVAVNAAVLPARGAVGLVKLLGRQTGISPWALGAVVLGGGALLLKQPDRRKAAASFAVKALEVVGTKLEAATAQERRGVEKLREVILAAPSRPTIRQRVAITLARKIEPLLAAEVHELIYAHFPDEPAVSVQDVRAVLEEGSEFVRVQRYRWQLGREVAPRPS
jgi:predicted nucleic acid-binding protein